MQTTEYNTTRHTVVTARRLGRPPKAKINKGTFDLLSSGEGPNGAPFALIDACVPLALAKTFKALFDAYEG